MVSYSPNCAGDMILNCGNGEEVEGSLVDFADTMEGFPTSRTFDIVNVGPTLLDIRNIVVSGECFHLDFPFTTGVQLIHEERRRIVVDLNAAHAARCFGNLEVMSSDERFPLCTVLMSATVLPRPSLQVF